MKTVLQEMHNHFGHFGIVKTYSLIKWYYYWPKMIKHIKAHVDSCSLCWREKMQADKYQLQMTEIPRRAFAKVSADLIVELPPTFPYNNKNILVMVDHLTGWPTAKAMPNKEATTVANAIFEKLILEHGAPEVLLFNNGKEFTNETLAHVCQEFNTEHFTNPYTPRSNGKMENFNKFLNASIRKLCQEDTAAWDQVLDQILFAYRCWPHTSTGEASYTLLYNRDLPLPLQKLIKCIEPYKGESMLGKRIEQSQITLSTAAKMLERMRVNQKRHYQHW